ncbi:hypothetical protein [Streptomyces sp. NPDC006925]|uniref:hypothetical protein n=1 Tax=Streptomyces sp. NPDC006925 TaxID=3364768 RepID=UPI0036BC225A
MLFSECYSLAIEGLVVRVASAGVPDEGKGTVVLQVEVPRQGRRPWEQRSDSWIVEVPAGQLEAAQALYAPEGKAMRDVEYRWVSIEIGAGHLKKSRPFAWLRRLLRQPLEIADVRRVEFADLYEDEAV